MSYAEEWRAELKRIDEDNPGVSSLRYFIVTAAQWHARFDGSLSEGARPSGATPHRPVPRVVVLGNGIPEQLIYACGAVPYFLMGGSHASCQWSDDVMPRDSDPVSRSILGYALRLAERTDVDPLFVVPVSNDNLRKIAYFLKREGHAVLPVEIPPEDASLTERRAWEQSARVLVEAVRRHMGGRLSTRSVLLADRAVGCARAAMIDFEHACAECDGALSCEASLLVLNTYYQTANLVQWTSMVRQLTVEVKARHRAMGHPCDDVPRILVVGSSILFPQYKVPALVQDAGLRLVAAVDGASTSRFANLAATERRGGAERLVRTIARKHYTLDSSGAHVVNHALEDYVEYLLSLTEVDGIVWHVLKGQIEHDFELTRLEPLFEQYDIPVFRLETDYQQQDVEQLRIRLEAFAEMLVQRAFVASQANARLRCA